MKLLYVNPPDDTTAKVLSALARHPELSIDTASHIHGAGKCIAAEPPDAVLMVSHPDAAHWASELTAAGWRGTTVLLVPADDCDNAEALMQHPGIICLAAENVEAPYFPRLLDRLVQTDRTQHLRRRLRQAEDALSQLRHFDALKGQFIQNVSHELRTPLAIVKGYVDLIADGSLGASADPLLNQAIQAIHTHTNNLVRLVDSITTLGDADVGRLSLVPQPLYPICDAAVKAIWQHALRRNITIVSEIPQTLPAVDIDAEGMLRALNHVLENAVKFSPEGSEVRFLAFADDSWVRLQVKDNGIGIPTAQLDRVFDRFYQVDGQSTRRYGGMGIGLSLVKEVVQIHHGEVWAESPGEGQGATISIKLPIGRNEAESLSSEKTTA